MTGTELAIKLGFIVSKDGRVFLNDYVLIVTENYTIMI